MVLILESPRHGPKVTGESGRREVAGASRYKVRYRKRLSMHLGRQQLRPIKMHLVSLVRKKQLLYHCYGRRDVGERTRPDFVSNT